MDDTSKYLIHAAITADGIVERSDVVGAIFGQTEGLLGDDLDLRDLQQASKVGRIDVEIDSEGGQSFGHITIATSLDRVETSILAASLETITRVGPCRSELRVTEIEDVREAKRREVVERAKELLAESFNESIMTSTEILDEVRESVRVEDITEYEGLPAGPHVADSDAIVVVEGRADVLTLLKYGIKNAVAVEGTNVPEPIAELTHDRTVTAFLDGDRGGELILRELAQVGDVDYVAFAPKSRSVEDLGRPEVMSALRDKVRYESFSLADRREESDAATPSATDADPDDSAETTDATAGAVEASEGTAGSDTAHDDADGPAGDDIDDADDTDSTGDADSTGDTDDADSTGDTDGADTPAEASSDGDGSSPAVAETDGAGTATDGPGTPGKTETATPEPAEPGDASAAAGAADAGATDGAGDVSAPDAPDVTEAPVSEAAASDGEDAGSDGEALGGENEDTGAGADVNEAAAEDDEPIGTLRGVARDVIAGETGEACLTDDSFRRVASRDAEEAFDLLKDADEAPYALFVDGEVTQRVLDLAAQRGTDHVVGRTLGEFVKRPVSVRIRTAEQLLGPRAANE